MPFKNTILGVIPPSIKKLYVKQKKETQWRRKYAGNSVRCPICNSSYKVFAPHGLVERKNARCHRCNSLERHRFVWLFLHRCATYPRDSQRSTKLLHFAPNEIFHREFSNSQYLSYHPVDLFPDLYDFEAGEEVKFADITHLPFEDNYFEVILCSHVLEHVPNDRKAIRELLRVMRKDGGFGIFLVPIDHNREETYEDFSITDPLEREKAFGQADHVRWYGKDFPERLREVGFKVDIISPTNFLTKKEINHYVLLRKENIYYCTPA